MNNDFPVGEALKGMLGREGFRCLPAHELFAGSPLVEQVTEQINQLDPADFVQGQLARQARLLLDLLRETLARRYTGTSVAAFAQILAALDYFVRVKDEVPDTKSGGYTDDLQVVNRVLEDFRKEFDNFRRWKAQFAGKL
jgi:uncharacterized membrane protein YkvA (DUF1232 family)